MKKDALASFPKDYVPTKQQTKILNRVNSFLNGKKKYAIISAPTGAGKSFVSKAICNTTSECSDQYRQLALDYDLFKRDYTSGRLCHDDFLLKQSAFGAFILTITKNLQDQYIDQFDDIRNYKGKSNYDCEIEPEFDVQTAPCVFAHKLRDECWENDICPYYKARNNALSSRVSTLNYRKFLTVPPEFKEKEVIICDEASELEEELVSTFSLTVNYKDLKYYDINHSKLVTLSYSKARQWLNSLLIEVEEQKETLASHHKRVKRSQRELNKLKFLLNMSESLAQVEWNWQNCEYVIDKNADRVIFTPLKINNLTKHIFNHAKKVVLMSATFIDIDQYCKDIGISKKDCDIIHVESTFDPEKSPIIVSDRYKINFKTKHAVLPKLMPLVKGILDYHKDDKGVIHTHSMDITQYISDKLNDPRLIIRDQEISNDYMLREHAISDSPTVLVSPSLRFGVDLKDELARFQIIMKVPYPPLSDKRISKLFKEDKDWYTGKTLSTLVQTCGRATRSTEDYAVTYILDASVVKLLEMNRNKLPEHFVKRIR